MILYLVNLGTSEAGKSEKLCDLREQKYFIGRVKTPDLKRKLKRILEILNPTTQTPKPVLSKCPSSAFPSPSLSSSSLRPLRPKQPPRVQSSVIRSPVQMTRTSSSKHPTQAIFGSRSTSGTPSITWASLSISIRQPISRP